MENLVIRKLKFSDYDSFSKLINDFRETSFTREQFESTLNVINQNSNIIVIEQNKELIATGTIIFEYKFIFNICCLGHIEDVCVKKEFRNMGLGKVIVNELVKIAKQKECYKVILDCSDSNRGFYEKCNFERRGNQMSFLIN